MSQSARPGRGQKAANNRDLRAYRPAGAFRKICLRGYRRRERTAMAITCNFEKDDREELRKGERLIVRIPPGHAVGTDTPGLKPCKNGAYLWVMGPRRRSGKGWREESIN